jgi:hypothetical protein
MRWKKITLLRKVINAINSEKMITATIIVSGPALVKLIGLIVVLTLFLGFGVRNEKISTGIFWVEVGLAFIIVILLFVKQYSDIYYWKSRRNNRLALLVRSNARLSELQSRVEVKKTEVD